ncbi:hypothetical protein K438DRAFT_1643926 [Mycena galopus ATCC 62051]|nr:hypothetical protein K438DRAFT_1643926 [Mycena galopus ATCC 62051]
MGVLLVDDNDPSVQYNPPGGWSRAGIFPEFDATTHTSVTRGDTAALKFEGTGISVYGTVAPTGSTGQSKLNFSIDGVQHGSYEGPVVPGALHNHLFWASPTLNETSHQLSITVDHDTSLPQAFVKGTFFLDYFVYTTTATAGKAVLVDDNDWNVTYSSDGWQNSNNSDCLESTQHISMSAGSWAALSFNGAFPSPRPRHN